jgi:hypothetical protein
VFVPALVEMLPVEVCAAPMLLVSKGLDGGSCPESDDDHLSRSGTARQLAFADGGDPLDAAGDE